jgi:predicted nucleic acid-binding protein
VGDVPLVFDVNVLVQAILGGHSSFSTWPTRPPTTENPAADCIGVANDGLEFALWLSPHILTKTARVLAAAGVEAGEVEEYADVLAEIADSSGSGVLQPPRTVHDCADHEDNLVLDLAAEVGALLIVSDDTDLTSMSPWRGTPILRPSQFASHRRRRTSSTTHAWLSPSPTTATRS